MTRRILAVFGITASTVALCVFALNWNGALYRAIAFRLTGFVMVDGLRVYVNGQDTVLTPTLLMEGSWERPLTEAMLDNIRDGDVVIDVGANVGYYTLLAARKVGPRGHVIAFEPDPTSFAILKRNAEANGFRNVTIEQKALSNRRGKLRLYLSSQNQGDHRIFPAEEKRPSIEVETLPLDEYVLPSGRLSFVKIDTQGAEGIIIEGMAKTIRNHPEIKIILEYSPHLLRRANCDPGHLIQRLVDLGFELTEVKSRSPITPYALAQYPPESDPEGHMDLFLYRPR